VSLQFQSESSVTQGIGKDSVLNTWTAIFDIPSVVESAEEGFAAEPVNLCVAMFETVAGLRTRFQREMTYRAVGHVGRIQRLERKWNRESPLGFLF
jgi:hypothetical protein